MRIGRCYLLHRMPLLLVTLAMGATAARASEAPATLLGMAWEEYGLQAFANAEKLFTRVADGAQATPEQRWQALLGQAFVTHYQMPGRDPEAAIGLYEALLKQVGDHGEWRGQVLGRLADCHVELTPPQVDKARALYQEAIAALPPRSLQAQETMLRLLSSYLQQPDRDEMARGLERAAELSAQFENTVFTSVFHGLRAEMAFFIDDYETLVEALLSQYQAGINNVKVKEVVLFRLARLYELKFGDYTRAEEFYRRLAAEIPSSQKAYFCILRADELKAGKLESAYAPPLLPRTAGTSPKVESHGQ